MSAAVESPKDAARTGRGKAKATLELIEACHKILSEIQPASVRAVCYRLFAAGHIPNMSKGSTNKVSRALVYAREKGIVPWEWVVDETRKVERPRTWDNPDEIIQTAVDSYRRDYWKDQPVQVEVWSEKGTIRGTLKPVLDELGVAFRVMHGFASATAVNDIADLSNALDKPLIALYAGDYDPSGLFMSQVDLPARIERYGGTVKVERIALLREDTEHLPFFRVTSKKSDARYKWWHEHDYGSRCWELDAMPPPELRNRVRQMIEAELNWSLWNHAIKIEQAETDSMREFLSAWNSNLRPALKYLEATP